MNNIFDFLCAILLFQTGKADKKNTIPVFMIDEGNVMTHIQTEPNPFQKMSSSEFGDIVREASRRSDGVIIFVEETFSVDDISLKHKGVSPYNYLRRSVLEKKAKYFPSVVEPYKLLTEIFKPHELNIFYLKTHAKLKVMDSFKYLYIYFQDGLNETRSDLLTQHDLIIREVCLAVQQLKSGPIIAFYTGKSNPVQVENLNFTSVKPTPVKPKKIGFMLASYGALFRFSDVHAATPSRRDMIYQMPKIANEKLHQRGMSTKIAYNDFEMEFNFNFLKDQWVLDNVAILEAGEEVGRTRMEVGAPWNMSYRCAAPIVIVNTRDGSKIVISEYQIQPRHLVYPKADDEELQYVSGIRREETFDNSVDCSNYFNPVIVTNLMISFLFFSILMYGVVSLMGIRTNDRYEDPQSKQLVNTEM